MAGAFSDELDFAEDRIQRANIALDNQIELIERLRVLKIDTVNAGETLARLRLELRQWQEYKTLLLIRIGMTLDHPVD